MGRTAGTIITGPVFAVVNGRVSYQVIGKGNVAVPTHLFKIVADAQNAGKVETLAFLLPNTRIGAGDLSDFLVSIDEIERLTGLDFLPALSKKEAESRRADRTW
jgi:DNA/RNA endonuclease G (NUC1)